MAVFGGILITNNGRNLLARAQTGKEFKLKRIALGDGNLSSSESMVTLSNLKHEVLSCNISGLKVTEGNAKVVFVINNQTLETGFIWKELGIIAEDPDTKAEILCYYANAGDNGEYIAAKGNNDILEKRVSINLIIDNNVNITATINESLVFATKGELDELVTKVAGLEDTIDGFSNYDDTAIQELIGNKVDKETGKGLSTNDYTTEEKTKLAGLENYDDTALQTAVGNKANKKKVWNITLDTTWTGTTAPYTKTVSVEGITANDIANLELVHSNNIETAKSEVEQFSKISKIVSSAGSITLTCYEEKPEIALNVRIEVMY